ncbi:NfeD family protein [Reinekea marina]|uniref:NfeD family protein n=1 Tax=Reinekea marina TaxID=1310421 RepID=A0ABV7WNU9_9GAMM|nr:NfeD family protein [Reinekea marina]MDN3647793.1 NfeD family protein [Reinekea marina]
METLPLIWVIIGAVLIVIEFLVPGAVFGFIGAAAMLTGVLIHFGHIEGFVNIMMTFFIASFVFILFLRSALLKLFPDNSVVQNTDELQDAIGRIVEVTEDISPYKRGRIKYLETSWEAQAETDFVVGEQAVIAGQDGNCWIVKSIEGN